MIRKAYTDPQEFHTQNQALDTALPFLSDTGILHTPLTIGNKTIPNRLVCQAMEGCDGTPSGSPDILTKRRYDRFAKGGAGLIWFEATAVIKEGRANPRQLYINESNLDNFKKQVESIKETTLKENGHEPLIIMQATHSGRYSKPFGEPRPIIAVNNPIFEKDYPIDKSRILSDERLDSVDKRIYDLLQGSETRKESVGL